MVEAPLGLALAAGMLAAVNPCGFALLPAYLGGLLAAAGGYVAYYGWYEIRVLRGGVTTDPIVDAAEQAQRWLANGLGQLGVGWLAVLVGLLAGGPVAVTALRRIRHRPRESGREEQISVREKLASGGRAG